MTAWSSYSNDDHEIIIWRRWSSFQNDDHQWGYGDAHQNARHIPLSQFFCVFVWFWFFQNFQMHRPSHADKYLANWDSSHCSWQWKRRNELCFLWQFPPGFSWWRIFTCHHHAALILGMFWHKTLRMYTYQRSLYMWSVVSMNRSYG